MNPRRALTNPSLWLLASLAFLAGPVCSAEKPLIAVQFKIEAAEYQDNLAKVLTKVEKDLTTDLVQHFRERFSFYEWTSGVDLKDPRLAALLTVSLAHGDRGAPNWNIVLVFAAEIRKKGAAFNCSAGEPKPPPPSVFLNLPLYSGSEEQPTGKNERLRQDIHRKITDSAQDQALQKYLADGFFRHVPFFRNAEPVAHLVVIRMNKDALGAQEGSRIDLDFCAKPRNEHLASGTIPLTVRERERVEDGEYAGLFQAVPGDPQFHGLSRNYDPHALFDSALKQSFGLFMVEFNQGQPNTSPMHATTSASAR